MGKTNTAAKTDYAGMSPADIFQAIAGGETQRGAVSKTIRALLADGYTTGVVAKMLGKRYQHVRNVAKEPLKKAE